MKKCSLSLMSQRSGRNGTIGGCAILTVVCALLSGCASSERMFRMSGGVAGEYSAPNSLRIRSEKYQAKSNVFASGEREAKIAGMDSPLVNIWPFYFRSANYVSILWPLIDCDRYGVAVRPFFNQEGDEYSVLFPLTAWNPVKRDGWVLLWGWSPEFYTMFPLAWHSRNANDGLFWYTPLLIHSWKNNTPTWQTTLRSRRFTEIMLAYCRREVYADISGRELWINDKLSSCNNVLAYVSAKKGEPVPKNQEEYTARRKEILATLPETENLSWGFFPLFGYGKSQNGSSLNILGPLFYCNNDKKSGDVAFLGVLGGKYSRRYLHDGPHRFGYGKKSFNSLPLLSHFAVRSTYADTPEVVTLRGITNLGSNSMQRNLPEIKNKLRKIAPDAVLPDTVKDYQTLNMFLDDLTAGRTYPVTKSYSGGVLPLFYYDCSDNSSWWMTPAALTGYRRRGSDSGSFWSVPLLSYASWSKNSSVTAIGWPLVWYSKTCGLAYLNKPIKSRDIYWVKDWEMTNFQDDYAALGLYYHGRNAFFVAKENVSASVADRVRVLFLTLSRQKEELAARKTSLDKRAERSTSWRTNGKIEYYRRLIELEEIRLEREKLRQDEVKFAKNQRELEQLCQKLKFDFAPAMISNRASAEKRVEELFRSFAELRAVEDWGNGIFYRKQLLANGDYSWRFMLLLANGRKEGDFAEKQICHFLYRHRQRGASEETVFFPFVTIRKEGANEEFSFLWRLFSHQKENGKSKVHILFIPFS